MHCYASSVYKFVNMFIFKILRRKSRRSQVINNVNINLIYNTALLETQKTRMDDMNKAIKSCGVG